MQKLVQTGTNVKLTLSLVSNCVSCSFHQKIYIKIHSFYGTRCYESHQLIENMQAKLMAVIGVWKPTVINAIIYLSAIIIKLTVVYTKQQRCVDAEECCRQKIIPCNCSLSQQFTLSFPLLPAIP